MKIKRFDQINEGIENKVIEHYFVRQHMEVKGIKRQQGDGKELIINSIGVIKEVKDFNEGKDIAYAVEFPIEMENRSTYGKKWKTSKNTFYILHYEDGDKIIRIF